jgi:hypothetical protein
MRNLIWRFTLLQKYRVSSWGARPPDHYMDTKPTPEAYTFFMGKVFGTIIWHTNILSVLSCLPYYICDIFKIRDLWPGIVAKLFSQDQIISLPFSSPEWQNFPVWCWSTWRRRGWIPYQRHALHLCALVALCFPPFSGNKLTGDHFLFRLSYAISP